MTAFNNYKAVILADSPIGYYRLNETSGTTANDSSGNGNNGTINNSPTLNVASLLIDTPDTSTDKAMTFASASSQDIHLPTSMVPTGANPWSLECWFKFASVPASGTHQTLMGWGASTGNQKFGALNFNSNGTTFQLNFSTNSGDITSGNLSTGTIYHAVGTYDGVSTRLYLNGSLVAGPTSFTLSLVQNVCDIASYSGGPYSSSFLNATLDEVAFYTAALSATQVANHHNAGRAISKTLGVRFRLTNQNTKTLGVRALISTKATKTLGTRARISTLNTKTLGVRFVLMPSLASGGFAVFGNGTGTASYDHFRVTQYPDPSAPLTNAGRAINSVVNWNGNVPANTGLTVYTSVDNGVTYQQASAAGNQIPGISTLLYSTLVLQRQPSGYYHLSEAVGSSTVADSSSNGYTGTLHGGVTLGVAGALQGPGELGNTAAQFDGSSGYISLASGLKTDGWSNLAVSCWFSPGASVASTTRLIANDSPATSHNGIDIGVNTSLAGCYCQIGNGTTFATATFSTALSIGTWYHLVATWDGTTIKLYMDGVQQATASLSGSVGTAAQALAIGYNPALTSSYFNGSIAEVSFTNPTTTNAIPPIVAADVFARYNAGISQVGTAANDSFTADTHTSYTQTNGTGGSGATWTWDTANSRLIAVGGSKAILLYNNLGAYDNDLLIDLYQSENAGLIWGWQNASNYYELVISDSLAASPNVVTLNKISGGSTTQLATTAITWQVVTGGVTINQVHHRFHLTMLSGVITVSMDENQILTYTDATPLPAGSSGIRNDTGTSYIYALQITPQPISLAATALISKHVLTSSDPTQTPQITDHQAFASDQSIGIGALVPSVDYRQAYVSDNIDDLNTKSNYWWQVGSDKNIVFQPRSAKNAPYILQSSDVLIGTLPTVEYSGDLYRNRQVLKGVYDTSSYTKTFNGDGQARSWSVDYPVVAVPNILVNGLFATVGLQGKDTGKQFYYTLNSTAITQDNSQTILSSTDTLTVQYTGSFGIDFSIDNTGQIANTISQAQMAAKDNTTGIIEEVEDVSQQAMNKQAATDYANQLLQRYGSIARTIVFQTLHNGLHAGHSLPIFIPQLNIFDSVFLVVEVQITVRTLATGQIQYVNAVTASEAAALTSWTKMFSRIMRSVTGTKAKA